MNGMLIVFLVFHVLCCIVTFVGIFTQILDVHKYMFLVVLLLPFWGFLMVLILHFQIAFKADDSREIDMEKMRLDSELYKSVTVEEKKNASSFVPMEEALIVNSAHERRELIMDVLNDNPKDYIEFLKKAGNNDDTEVVHYAVTAMVEISKENDFMLQYHDKKYSENPDDFNVLSEYCDFLWSCLEQNLMQGQVEVMNRNTFNDLITKKLLANETVDDLLKKAKNSIRLKNYSDAGVSIDRALALEPDNEEAILQKIRYYALVDKGEKIKELIANVEKNRIFLSAKAREEVAFWTE